MYLDRQCNISDGRVLGSKEFHIRKYPLARMFWVPSAAAIKAAYDVLFRKAVVFHITLRAAGDDQRSERTAPGAPVCLPSHMPDAEWLACMRRVKITLQAPDSSGEVSDKWVSPLRYLGVLGLTNLEMVYLDFSDGIGGDPQKCLNARWLTLPGLIGALKQVRRLKVDGLEVLGVDAEAKDKIEQAVGLRKVRRRKHKK